MGPAREKTVPTHTTVLKSATLAAMEALITIMRKAANRYIPGLKTRMMSPTNDEPDSSFGCSNSFLVMRPLITAQIITRRMPDFFQMALDPLWRSRHLDGKSLK